MTINTEIVTAPLKGDMMIHVDSRHPFHANLYKTLTLLRLRDSSPIFFIVEGSSEFKGVDSLDELQQINKYFYESHTCPINFLKIEALYLKDDDDPHGLFEHIVTKWMTQDYLDAVQAGKKDEYLRMLFPESHIG